MAAADTSSTAQDFVTTLDATAVAERIESGETITTADTRVLAQSLLVIAETAMPDSFFATDSRCRLARAVLAHQQPGTGIRSGWVDLHTLDPEVLVETLHPDDELTGDHTTEAAFQARELLSYLIHAVSDTGVTRSVPDPYTARALIALSGQMANHLRQLLEQLADRQRRLADDPRATVDDAGRQHGGPDVVSELTAINVESAARKLGETNVLLRTAQSVAESLSFGQPDYERPAPERGTGTPS